MENDKEDTMNQDPLNLDHLSVHLLGQGLRFAFTFISSNNIDNIKGWKKTWKMSNMEFLDPKEAKKCTK